jgi:hypothetical protein
VQTTKSFLRALERQSIDSDCQNAEFFFVMSVKRKSAQTPNTLLVTIEEVQSTSLSLKTASQCVIVVTFERRPQCFLNRATTIRCPRTFRKVLQRAGVGYTVSVSLSTRGGMPIASDHDDAVAQTLQ